MFSRSRNTAAACLLSLAGASVGQAALITFQTPGGSTAGGQAVNAKATFTTGNGTIDVLVENFQANPTSVVQCISGVFFDIAGGPTGGTLVGSSGTQRTVSNDGTFADGAAVSTGWSFTNAGPAMLNVLGTVVGPEHLVIGPPGAGDLYSNANGSIAGNNPHNPLLGLSASFSLSVPGVTAATNITSATFQFGTSPGSNVTVPEPALGALALAALPFIRRRRAA